MRACACCWSTATTALASRHCWTATDTPKGSFYHHFKDKEDFALQVLDAYMPAVHAGLDACLLDQTLPPLARVRRFFEMTQETTAGGLYGLPHGRARAGTVRRQRGVPAQDRLVPVIHRRAHGACLDEARQSGDIPADRDVQQMADLLVNCWEGAALRSRLRRNPASLKAMLDFYIRSVVAG